MNTEPVELPQFDRPGVPLCTNDTYDLDGSTWKAYVEMWFWLEMNLTRKRNSRQSNED